MLAKGGQTFPDDYYNSNSSPVEPDIQSIEAAGKSVTGLVLWAMGHQAYVLVANREYLLPIPGRWRLRFEGIRPLSPGDKVELQSSANDWKIVEVCQRTNEFTRRSSGPKPQPQTIAVNLDQVIVVASAENPATPSGLIDRLLITAALGNVPALLIVNKIDIASQDRLNFLNRVYKNAVDEILLTSALTGEGLDCLKDLIISRITLLAGSSGVGKSTLINRIDPKLNLKTNEVSRITGKGRHVTSVASLHRVDQGGWIIDTPGLRECAPWGMTQQRLGSGFAEFSEYVQDCHFRDCLHKSEIGCVIKQETKNGKIPIERYTSYLKLLDEAT